MRSMGIKLKILSSPFPPRTVIGTSRPISRAMEPTTTACNAGLLQSSMHLKVEGNLDALQNRGRHTQNLAIMEIGQTGDAVKTRCLTFPRRWVSTLVNHSDETAKMGGTACVAIRLASQHGHNWPSQSKFGRSRPALSRRRRYRPFR